MLTGFFQDSDQNTYLLDQDWSRTQKNFESEHLCWLRRNLGFLTDAEISTTGSQTILLFGR